MVGTDILSNNMKSPFSRILYAIRSFVIYKTPPLSRHFNKPWPVYLTCPFTELRGVSIDHCDGWSMVTGDAHSSGHLIQSNFGLTCALPIETNTFSQLVVILWAFYSNILRYFLDLTYKIWNWNNYITKCLWSILAQYQTSVPWLFRAVQFNRSLSILAKCSINLIQIIMQVSFTLNVVAIRSNEI